MNHSTVLMTGAAGFIGNRLTHRLALHYGTDVRALVHSRTGTKVIRLARLPVDIVQGDVLDTDDLADAMQGVDAVVHCAGGPPDVNVDGTRNALEAAAREDVDRFVHLSSYVVHGVNPDADRIDETTPLNPGDSTYATSKKRSERIVREYGRQEDVPAVTFRPSNVYGPYGTWTQLPIEQLQEGLMLADGGPGAANLVHVDDLVDALIAGLTREEAIGETFLVVGDDRVTWREVYEAYANLLDEHRPIRGVDQRRIAYLRWKRLLADSTVPPVKVMQYSGRTLFDTLTKDIPQFALQEMGTAPWVQYLFARIPTPVQQGIIRLLQGQDGTNGNRSASTGESKSRPISSSESEDERYPIPDDEMIDLHTANARVSNRKLTDVLGWEPEVSFEEGMESIAEWMEYERLTVPAEKA